MDEADHVHSREAAQEKKGESMQVGNIQGQYLSQLSTWLIHFCPSKIKYEPNNIFQKGRYLNDVIVQNSGIFSAPLSYPYLGLK